MFILYATGLSLLCIALVWWVIWQDKRGDDRALRKANYTQQPVLLARGNYVHIFFPSGWYAPALWVNKNNYRSARWFCRNGQSYCVAIPVN